MYVGWPQGIYLTLQILWVGINLANHGKEKRTKIYNFWHSLVDLSVILSLLWWGGFFERRV